ncbi:GntR family transcriptional regulator [Priestia endophytica]|uniref:GntR family transcriptional regulator n=1 Tax=Priestia endophytica TaxID=135735 RepID=UPI002E21505F|nr:GntR family transcriptional regulator [Priestia endophytica]
MSDFKVQKPLPYYEQFYNQIKKMIFTGKFKPGQRIVETQLAKEFNVSKSPIREAIRLLEKEGLVHVDEKSRVMVYNPTVRDVEEIYFCRMALESFATKLATEKASEEKISQLEHVLKKTEEVAVKENCQDELIHLNESFHYMIVEYTKNARLKKQIDELNSLVHFCRILNFRGEERTSIILSQHHDIFEKMKKRDKEGASASMVQHLEHDLVHLKEVLAEQDYS